VNIQSLFGDVPVAKFVDEYLHRLPFAMAGAAACACDLGTWDALGTILEVASQSDILAVRGGEWHTGQSPRDANSARSLIDQGYTVFIRHAERCHVGLAELARTFEATFLGPVNIHVFATPAGAPGFSWHYDAEDVFIIQTAGEKEYSLRKNTVNPWPLEETLPSDMQYERELTPLMRVLLRAGDLLYIPCGYWHKAEAKGRSHDREERGSVPIFSEQKMGTDPDEAAISLAVGVMSRSAMDVYDFLRARLLQSLAWRQRLPLANSGATSRVELESKYQYLLEQLANDLARTMADPRLVTEFLEWAERKGAGDGKATQ
jgi:hypothetical protein